MATSSLEKVERAEIGKNVTFKLKVDNASYSHTLNIKYKNSIITFEGAAGETTIVGTIPLKWASYTSTTRAENYDIELFTYDSKGGLVGVYNTTAIFQMVEKPSCWWNLQKLTETNTTITTNNIVDIIQNHSKLKYTFEFSTYQYAKYNSCVVKLKSLTNDTVVDCEVTISSEKTSETVEGRTDYVAEVLIDKLTSFGEYKVYVQSIRDSRYNELNNLGGGYSKDFTVIEYNPPMIETFWCQRSNSSGTPIDDGENVVADINVTLTSLNEKNTATYRIQYKSKDASSWTTATSWSTTHYNGTKVTGAYFSSDQAWDIRLTVTDLLTTSESNVDIPTAFVIMDFHNSGDGLAFGKVSEQSGLLDINYPTEFKKSVTFDEGGSSGSIPEATFECSARFNNSIHIKGQPYIEPIQLSNSDDMNNITTSGVYDCTYWLDNTPVKERGLLFVMPMNEYGYCYQKYSTITGAIYERFQNDGTWTTWKSLSDTAGGVKVLASGAWHMSNSQTVYLDENISDQKNGIILVFSRYDNSSSSANDYWWNTHFVHKHTVSYAPGKGHSFFMSDGSSFSDIGGKYLYISDYKIVGYTKNNVNSTGSGITFKNANFVLRYVIGV